jgi:DNA-binding LytR/AlgR family response regulator
VLKAFIQLAARASVQPARDGWIRPRDELSGAPTATPTWTGGGAGLSIGAVYGIVVVLIAASTVVNTFSTARDISWRLGAPDNLWEPALWNVTSSLVGIALLPLIRHAALLVRTGADRPVTAGAAFVALAFVYSALHIAGMGLLRELAYWIGGWNYSFPWSRQILYELRKDLFSYLALAIIFWFAERPAAAAAAKALDEVVPKPANDAPVRPEFWLRDGRMDVLIDPGEIVSVRSAGNYVEYQLTGRRSHLIRMTLQAEEARLARFGIVRVHRTCLLNPRRIVALERRPSGDFEVRLDTGEVVLGSRRFKDVVARIG